MKYTRDPVTGHPAIELQGNLLILKSGHTPAQPIGEIKADDIQTVLTPQERKTVPS